MGVTLRKRKNSNGSTSLYLDIIHNKQRIREFLPQLSLVKPGNHLDRDQNKERERLAKEIALQRALELQATENGIITDAGKKTVVLDWLQGYVNNYKKKDLRNMQGAVNRFRDFLQEEKFFNLTFKALNEQNVIDFRDYLNSRSKGEGGTSYFTRFKKMIKSAKRERLVTINPAEDVRATGPSARKKDVLTMDEIRLLKVTPTENNQIRNAFIFSCMTGLRWCDITTMKWNQIKYLEKQLDIRQNKTGKDLSIPLNTAALALMGEPGKADQYVFTLPSANGANKTLKAWVKRAGISKSITWHNARHSFGTNLIFNEVDVYTTSKLLGHTSLKHTQRYVDTAQELKIKAVNKICI